MSSMLALGMNLNLAIVGSLSRFRQLGDLIIRSEDPWALLCQSQIGHRTTVR
jgi:hypothetical protein